ncbi:molybdenum cofactor guanylyltransferase [Aureimonas fodinaquatilis]|uniref:Molybdenum cofactor guanylyltransferase n=1 Tax=Aureimonas fodinaquatilis TaxID=2565783 RepID=A0A5B0DUP8_9HYPH|nr:molybdenum cofactor guanylyltransferase MobA [Aureimonas fodinaquatilis]KAA0970186.1 molybdenum cofactor guanylyltransferase [Aureimonas fodinaquatilis]
MTIAGVILAGGEGTRMGGLVAKPLTPLGKSTLIERIIPQMQGQVSPLLINAALHNGFERLGLPVVPDMLTGHHGPLAGLSAAAAHLERNFPRITHLLSVAGDTPFLPIDYVSRMCARSGTAVNMASSNGRAHPTAALWPMALLSQLEKYLSQPDAKLQVMAFARRTTIHMVEFQPFADLDPFFNVNTPDDLRNAQRFLPDE